MASITQFYPCNNFAPYSPSTFKGGWTTNPSSTYLTLADDKTGAAVTILGNAAVALNNKIGIRACVSNPLEAQTISGNLDIAINVQETNADANFFTRVYLYVTVGDTNAVRGVLLDFADTGGTEWGTTSLGTVFNFSAPQALTPVVCTAGDRIVMEFGVQAVAGSASSRTAQLWWGSTKDDGTILTDAVVGATGTGNTRASFIEFDTPVLISRPDAATGDLLAGNRELYLYDGTTGALKRRILPIGSSDPAGGAQIVSGGTLYITYESLNAGDDEENGQVAMYDPVTLAYLGVFQTFPGVGPHSLCPNQAGSLFTGFTGDGATRAACGESGSGGPSVPVTPASGYIRKFSSAGALEASFAATVESGATNSIDLSSDQATMLYTSLGREIKQYNVLTDVQMANFATLPAAADGEIARGMRILPDTTVLVVDKINIKRVQTGTVIQTYTVTDQDDWGTLALAPDGLSFWVANRADDAVVPPMICKIDVETGTVLLTIDGDDVPDTEGGMCSGGITVINGYRASLAEPEPPPTPEVVYPNWLNSRVTRYPRRLIRSPTISANGNYVRLKRLQLDMQPGMAEPPVGVPRDVQLRMSIDGGNTWSNFRVQDPGDLGQYLARLDWWQVAFGRNIICEIVDHLPNVIVRGLLEAEDTGR